MDKKLCEEIIQKEFVYSVPYFSQSLDKRGINSASFSTRLRPDIVKKLADERLSEKEYERLQTQGKEIINSIWGKINIHTTSYVFYKEDQNSYSPSDCSSLLEGCNVPGNACCIKAPYEELSHFLKKSSEDNPSPYLEYHPHNVDTMKQASTLLSLWVNWINSVRSKI